MKKKSIIIIGWINYGKPAVCGETMKNQLCIKKLESYGIRCHLADFYKWKKHPQVFVKLFFILLFYRKATIIFSTSAQNSYPMMRLLKFLRWKQNTVHWVIGGSFAQKVKSGIFKANIIQYIKWNLVESNIMVQELNECGIKNVIQVPNFKPIEYIPQIPEKGDCIKFVFLSRIMPEKGCDYILKASEILNKQGLTDRFIVDFYGKITESYEQIFLSRINDLKNVNYKGFLNLRERKGYDILSQYHIMLFPTFWIGEGFAGVFIDAFISGVPMIASEWAHNRQFMKEGETALFVPVHNIKELANKMKGCIDGKYDLKMMSQKCQLEAQKYNIDNVITEELLKKVGIL